MTSLRRAGLVAVLATGSTVWLSTAPAQAAAPPSATAPVMVVLDASGSMTASDAPGPRIDAAKRAVDDLVGSLPSTR